MRSMVEGACSKEARLTARAPSTTLLRSAVPLPRSAGQDDKHVSFPLTFVPFSSTQRRISLIKDVFGRHT